MTMKSVHKKSTKRITLRLHENILEILNNESDKRDLPINAIIGRILANYVKFDMNKNIIPTITMSQLLLSKILHRLNESEKKELFLQGPKTVKKLFALLNLEYNVPNVIENYFTIVGKYCGWYTFEYFFEKHQYHLIFKSDLGDEWITFLVNYLKTILQSLNIKIESEKIHDSVIIFEFFYDAD